MKFKTTPGPITETLSTECTTVHCTRFDQKGIWCLLGERKLESQAQAVPSFFRDQGLGASKLGCCWGTPTHRTGEPLLQLPRSSGDFSLLHLRYHLVEFGR